MKDIQNTFIEKLHECNQHKKRLQVAKRNLKQYMPIAQDSYSTLQDEDISFIDQLIFRFSKLQDTMGDKLFPSLLELVGENVKDKTFIDRLNRLEELGLVDRVEWMSLRKDRNEIAHEYSFNQDEVIDSINLIYNLTEKLINVYDGFYNYCYEKFDFIKNSTILVEDKQF